LDEKAFKREVLVAFEYSYKHDNWVFPLADTLSGVTAEEAAWRAGPESKGIWDIVLHMAVWTENIIERMRSGEHARPPEGAWPPPPAAMNEAAWEAAKRRLWDSLSALQAYMEANSIDQLAAGPYGLGDLFCRFIHNAYHIGQITKMRDLRNANH
jgi:hypothetical protein